MPGEEQFRVKMRLAAGPPSLSGAAGGSEASQPQQLDETGLNLHGALGV